MALTNILGFIATFLFSVCYIPQIIVLRREKNVSGLSLWLLLISFMANIDALVYASRIHQIPLQIKYSAALVFLSVCIFYYFKVKNYGR